MPSSEAGSSDSEVPSSVLLAIPDGPIPSSSRPTHTLSFIGGYPTFPSLPSSSSSSSSSSAPSEVRCGVCHAPIPLLSQVYCPLEGGENDRTIYVWGCNNASCQRRNGSVRAFRASVRNEEYARDAERKRLEAKRLQDEEKARAKVNPFSMNTVEANGNLFGAQPLFGAAPIPPASTSTPPPPDLSTLSLQPSTSVTHAPPIPAYLPSQYIATIDEYLPLPDDSGDHDMNDSDDDDEDENDATEPGEGKVSGWGGDNGWDQLLPKGVDEVFERFVRRIQNAEDASTQVLRYDFNATPLPYSASSSLFRSLFPSAPTKRSSDDEEVDPTPFYTNKSVPPCTRCKSKRVFELQLVPPLINVLRPANLVTGKEGEKGKVAEGEGQGQGEGSEEERKKELARIAKEGRGEMEWGTVMVFACEGDCVGVGEEWVGVEWESQEF